MNTTKLTAIAIALIAASSSAVANDALGQTYAQNQEFVEFINIPSTQSRAQVRAALDQTQPGSNPEYVEAPRIVSGKSQAEVRAELNRAYAQGQLGQNQEFVEFLNVVSSKSREQVREEAIQAAKDARAYSSGN